MSNTTNAGPQAPQSQAAPTSRLLAAGFNAHGQLSPDTECDILNFIPICETSGSDLQVLFAGWSQTVIVAKGGLLCLGHAQETTKSAIIAAGRGLVWTSALGDINGLLLTLTSSNKVHILSKEEKIENEDPPRIGHIALAQNGRVALTFQQTPTAQRSHIMEFASYERFLEWYGDPSGDENYPDGHHMLPGRPKQLLANTGIFQLLMESGEVYTWGDPRYESLGRPIDAIPADKPGSVEALGGLQIAKIAAGGWMCAALSEDGTLYIWGTTSPGGKAKIGPLRGEDGGDVALVELPGGQSEEPLDVLDVGVGDDHIVVVAEGNRLFVVGENTNGQLATGDGVSLADWQEVVQPGGVRAVWCGPLTTFALVDVE
jgi:hypothetical protein